MHPSPPRHHRAPATRAGTALAAVLLAFLAGCGNPATDQATDPSSEPAGDPATADELAEHAGEPCPARLPSAERRVADEPAPAAPDLAGRVAAADTAWTCRYEPGGSGAADDGSGTAAGWGRAGSPVRLDPADLRALEPLLADLRPAAGDRVCTMDLGPRWLVVLAEGGDLTGVVVDGFGCRDVRVTDDPHETPPGAVRGATRDGLVPGVLTGPDRLLGAVRRAHGDR